MNVFQPQCQCVCIYILLHRDGQSSTSSLSRIWGPEPTSLIDSAAVEVRHAASSVDVLHWCVVHHFSRDVDWLIMSVNGASVCIYLASPLQVKTWTTSSYMACLSLRSTVAVSTTHLTSGWWCPISSSCLTSTSCHHRGGINALDHSSCPTPPMLE